MRGIGIMCNFQNTSGYAALVNQELGHLGVQAFGGVIMQPTAGGITLEVAKAAIGYGYGPGTGARFVSLPTHHTRMVAEREGRSPAFLETTFWVPPSGCRRMGRSPIRSPPSWISAPSATSSSTVAMSPGERPWHWRRKRSGAAWRASAPMPAATPWTRLQP